MSKALTVTLEFAVSLQILEIRNTGYISDAALNDALLTSELIASEGDTLLYGGDPGQAASLFNKVARAIAILSFQPGGFAAMGMKFENFMNY